MDGTLTLRIESDIAKKLKILAALDNKSRSKLVRELLNKAIEAELDSLNREKVISVLAN